MASLLIRNLDENLMQLMKEAAKRQNISLSKAASKWIASGIEAGEIYKNREEAFSELWSIQDKILKKRKGKFFKNTASLIRRTRKEH